ncbi:hypothetical protein H0I23_16450 [Cellulophaga sp. HaHaR_3_176]|uniref:COG1470 family protein n=1 Tax=Cellulophaga sp. HaHaR_3_176 TaxID=1942464 RepID=UPI001C1FFD15|nr:hypothetical protein [Cellulophaga sp. HaHaR_3_176]QWX84015.1 hypothetical protein H0I23_16450 [Cellulophaga sp. HaHaR_3_176]
MYKGIILFFIIFLSSFCVLAQVDIRLKSNDVIANMTPESKHTIVFEVQNMSEDMQFVRTILDLENDWEIISGGFVGDLKPLERKLVFITVYVPGKTKPGDRFVKLHLITSKKAILKSLPIKLTVPDNHQIIVNKLSSPELVIAGETIETVFEIRNRGNVTEKLELVSENDIVGGSIREIKPDSTLVITLIKETDDRNEVIRSENIFLNVIRKEPSKQVIRGYAVTKVYPTKMKREDAYFRLPVEASFYLNSFNSPDVNYSSYLLEAKGEGFLDLNSEHYFNFLIRTPNQRTVNRFGMNDQYTMSYRFKEDFNVIIGDYSYRANRLGFVSRYGFGFKYDSKIKNWNLIAFYSKPRFDNLYTESIVGVKVLNNISESLNVGISLSHSKENQLVQTNIGNELINQTGQIAVFETNYKTKNTTINHESSVSFTGLNNDQAHDLRVNQKIQNFIYTGNVTVVGKNYFGGLSNSFRYSNNIRYFLKKWGVSAGQALSKVNERYNPQFSLPEPYYENYFISANYRINQKHYTNVRFSNVLREDKQEIKSYFYKEYGLDYSYRYLYQGLSLSFTGRVAKTKNMLSLDNTYRNTYGNNLSASYQVSPFIGFRGNINQNYTNRYGVDGNATNYYNYGLGFNLNHKGRFHLSVTYNSGFSPEDDYLQRDFINLNFGAQIDKSHKISARLNYYENPFSRNNKELFSFLKYTYSFGAPIKRIYWQGSVNGSVFTNDGEVNVSKIKIIASGKNVYSDDFGNFELKNLSEGKNYVMIDDATLPMGIVTVQKMPLEVDIVKNEQASLNIELVRSGTIKGELKIFNSNDEVDNVGLESHLKIEGKDNTYYTESDRNGLFTLKSIVPGDYVISVMRLKKGSDLKTVNKIQNIKVNKGEVHSVEVFLKRKERTIKFKSSNFNVKL